MSKLQNLLTIIGIVILSYSCQEKDNNENQEIPCFPSELYFSEILYVADARLFIHGQEVFDRLTCQSFIHNEWGEWFGNYPRYDFFDESNYADASFIPKKIIFCSKDTAIFRMSSPYDPQVEEFDRFRYYSVKKDNPLFIFTYFHPDYSSRRLIIMVRNNNDDLWSEQQNNIKQFQEKITGKIIAEGNYTELELKLINYRYMQWREKTVEKFGIAARSMNELKSNDIIYSMQATDTLVFQEFRVKYRVQ